jgi:hypothetical protein
MLIWLSADSRVFLLTNKVSDQDWTELKN